MASFFIPQHSYPFCPALSPIPLPKFSIPSYDNFYHITHFTTSSIFPAFTLQSNTILKIFSFPSLYFATTNCCCVLPKLSS